MTMSRGFQCFPSTATHHHRIAVLSTELERLEQRFALAEQANPADLDLYQKLANTWRRLLTTIGLQRRAKTASVPTLAEYLRGPHREAAE